MPGKGGHLCFHINLPLRETGGHFHRALRIVKALWPPTLLFQALPFETANGSGEYGTQIALDSQFYTMAAKFLGGREEYGPKCFTSED